MSRKRKNREYIDARSLSLDEWLTKIKPHEKDRKCEIADWQFPSDEHLNEYLDSVDGRPESEVKSLLRSLLIPSTDLGADKWVLDQWLGNGFILEAVEKLEYARRLINFKTPTWEGITWILDLLPSDPQGAIDAVLGYQRAHIQFLPDGRIGGLSDAVAVIRAKYIHVEHPRENLLDLRSRDFEYLVGSLYESLGYSVSLTQKSRDGGYDVHATREDEAGQEINLIECKRYTHPVGVKELRSLHGVVESMQASRGILVTTSSFTKPAIEFASRARRIGLVDYKSLNSMMNKSFGSDWPRFIDMYINRLKRRDSPGT